MEMVPKGHVAIMTVVYCLVLVRLQPGRATLEQPIPCALSRQTSVCYTLSQVYGAAHNVDDAAARLIREVLDQICHQYMTAYRLWAESRRRSHSSDQ
jgi:hypothetical protein